MNVSLRMAMFPEAAKIGSVSFLNKFRLSGEFWGMDGKAFSGENTSN
jgi:hypothetical protein